MASIHYILEEHFLAKGDRERAAAVRRLAEALQEGTPQPPKEVPEH